MTLPASADLTNYPFPANARQYDFEFIRMMMQAMLAHTSAEGIAGASTDYAATPGAGLAINVAAGRAFVKGDDRTSQGSYFVYNDATKSVTVSAADATNPRVDRLVLRVRDADVTGVTTSWSVELVAGTPAAGATLTNLSGAAAVPNGALLLYNVLVPAAFAGPFVAATHFQDRRFNVPVAGRELFGGYAALAANNSTANSTFATITVNGSADAKVKVEAFGVQQLNGVDDGGIRILDGATSAVEAVSRGSYYSAGAFLSHKPEALLVPFSGSKTFNAQNWRNVSATPTVLGGTGQAAFIRATWGG